MKWPVIHPDSRFKVIWDLIILFTTITVTIQAPLLIIYDLNSKGVLLIFDIVISIIFAVDIFLNFNTGYIHKRELISNRGVIAKRYAIFWLWPDLLATIPFYAFVGTNFLVLNRLFRFFRLSRLLKLFTGARTIKKAKELNINPSIMRLMLLVFWILIAAHLITCAWIFIGGVPNTNGPFVQYIQGLYWTVTTLTTIGYGDLTADKSVPLQMIFSIIIELIGAGMYGFIIGNIANLIANIDVAKSQYREKMEKINTFMKYRNIPVNLQKRINDYYDYLWESRRGYDESSVLQDLPRSLKTQVSLFLNKDIIEKVPIFKGASPAFIKEIIMNMQPVVFTPKDYIVTKGEIGDDMYFISNGTVDVVSEDESIVYATLTAGQFFGEIAILLSTPRTATIKARDYCDLYSLQKDTFDRILIRYPRFARNIEELAEKRRQEIAESTAKIKQAEEKDAEEVDVLDESGIDSKLLPVKMAGITTEWNKEHQLVIRWDKPERGELFTIIRKIDDAGGQWKTLASGTPDLLFTDKELPDRGNVLIRVRAENNQGPGPWSEVITVHRPE